MCDFMEIKPLSVSDDFRGMLQSRRPSGTRNICSLSVLSGDLMTSQPTEQAEPRAPDVGADAPDNANLTAEEPAVDEAPADSSESASTAAEVREDETQGGTADGGGAEQTEAATADRADSQPEAPSSRPRVRLNPKVDPNSAVAVPSISSTTPQPAGEAQSKTAVDRPEAAPSSSEPAPTEPESTATDESSATEEPEPEAEQPAAEATTPTSAAPAVEIPDDENLDAQMEAEIAEALASGEVGQPEVSVPDAAEEGAPPAATDVDSLGEGARLKGRIHSVRDDDVFLDFGLRLSGIVSRRQFGDKKPPEVGKSIEVVVNKVDEEEGLIVCNLPRGAARVSGDWDALIAGQSVECTVNGTNKGGLDVGVGSIRGFMPASQVDLFFVEDLSAFVGQKFNARIIEVNPKRRRLVLSRRALLQEEREASEKQMLEELAPNQTRTGRVKTIKDYGAFVDLGGIDGFLHIGQISWARINHPSEVISEGQTVEVKVLTVDSDKKKISLGMRQLSGNPWSNVETKFPKGSTVTGKVTRTEQFGAFVELEPGVEGLVHISELDFKRVGRVTDVLSVGQRTDVQVLEIDSGRKRISLSVKALKAPPEEAAPEEAEAPPPERKRSGPLKGGIGGDVQGGLFGNPGDFS